MSGLLALLPNESPKIEKRKRFGQRIGMGRSMFFKKKNKPFGV
jgi:hypothetical protein